MSFSDEDRDSDDAMPCTSSGKYDGEVNVDAEVGALLAMLQMDRDRWRKPTEEDDEMLRRVHEQIRDVVRRESEEGRRRRFRKALNPASCIREEVWNLRRTPQNHQPAPSYFNRLSNSLHDIVTDSFDEDYRKVAIVLGLVDALAELIVLEVHVHGTMPRLPDHRSVRKLIANALTNLTFGHAPSKKRLCAYPDFILTVVRIFNEAKNLAQVYAGLIRNLSWMADSEMTASLLPCVQSLAAAAVDARKAGDEGCVRASLSALWNLASHSNESKRAICDEPGCLRMLSTVLTNDANKTVEIESASGILKYVSQYLANTTSHLDERPNLANSLIAHLNSASFTVLCNILGALSNMLAKDPHLQVQIRSNDMAMMQLNSLRDSARDDVRNQVKAVLNYLNQPSGFVARYGKMSSSMGYDNSGAARDTSRLLPLRGIRASPGAPLIQITSPFLVENQRCASLPRHFSRGGFTSSVHGQTHGQTHLHNQFASPGGVRGPPPASNSFAPPPPQVMRPPAQQQQHGGADFAMPEIDVDEEEDNFTQKCNRSNASEHSLFSELGGLGSEDPSGCNSILESVMTSTNLSPVSESELPASPTHYTILKMQKEREEAEFRSGQTMQPPLSIQLPQSTYRSGESDGSRHGGSDAATAIVEDHPTPTFHPMNTGRGRNGTMPEGEYAVLDTDLLQRSIESALPQTTPRSSRRQKSPMDGDHLLAETIQSAMPPPSQPKRTSPRFGGSAAGSDRLLMDCIQAAMPASPSVQRPKNENGGRSCTVTQPFRQPLPGHPADTDGVTTSVLFSTNDMAVRDASRLLKHHKSPESSDDSDDDCFGIEEDHVIDTSLPLDCLEEEFTIDCSVLSEKSRSVPKPSRLPKPTPRTSVSPRIPPKPALKPKPQTQAVISPYNYQKPKDPAPPAKSPDDKPVVHSSANTMLVTTV